MQRVKSARKYIKNVDKFEHFIIIPHYKKNPSISLPVLEKIKEIITAYEVKSPKNFFSIKKNEISKTPVLFSDFRSKAYNKDFQFPGKYTYLKCENLNFEDIKKSLTSPKNVSLTTDNEENVFDINKNEARAYAGINVILGKRSSGKTWLLNAINQQFENDISINPNQVLYIKQFDITNKSNFKSEVEIESKGIVKEYLQQLIEIFNFLEANINITSETELFNYVKSLKSYADHCERDVFSKCKLFNYKKIPEFDEKQIKDLIISFYKIKNSNEEYRKLIERYISLENIESLISELRYKFKTIYIDNYLIKLANDLCKEISSKLANNSSVTPIEDCDFKAIFKELYIKEKFNSLIGNFKTKTISEDKVFNQFKQKTEIFKEDSKTNRKGRLGINNKTNCDELVYLFLNFDTKITDNFNYSLSGGQESEYILLNKLKNHKYYDVVIIDEIENSFDNPFLNTEINSFLRKIAENSIVFISTHNNNIGVNLNPDYYIYCETKMENNKKEFLKFYGKSTDKNLKDSKNRVVSLNEILIKTMEASTDAYVQRKSKYNFEN